MSLIKQHLYKLENGYPIELTLTLNDVELILELLDEAEKDPYIGLGIAAALADEIREQTYA